jgi:hypothetical protein
MVTRGSLWAKGRISVSIRAERSSMVADSSSMHVRCMRHKNEWCSPKLPVRASTRAEISDGTADTADAVRASNSVT